ncbi:C4-dicarboxylate ABC transporter [Acidithiobacillus thiooxidans]|uniref:C4-dicarboxylate ABC transporter n=2 Tax=Acidithiobacillus TaxID=119977 RepID=A0A1C2I3S4_ACITH|nr:MULTISPECIES: tellurite resistance/C4-dicarboxylate transporter family protein [Acidithiobacillus]MBU2759420.1 C4-dicarboxylate ABC transporter [Acidithiobacillus sulfurivorans]MBU2836943.1 C4-dicarboxylate ABC transporter [Acidithiobacillus thiooxidans]OCX70644.1 hypothetical protein A6M23_13635 [Acidithiobacillus thiooxidans]OCX83026.1 hypothetical protein A6P08_11235 [Acidithiobacillus thiooxidans]
MKTDRVNSRNHRVISIIQYLAPGYFAVVMATGAIALSAKIIGVTTLPNVLLWINVIIYLFLWIMLTMRIIKFPEIIMDDFRDLGRGTGFLTIVAGSAILGSQFILLDNQDLIGIILLGFAGILWLILNYGLIFGFITKIKKPSFEKEIGGSWLLITVSIQSIAVLLSVLELKKSLSRFPCFNFTDLSLWLLGDAFYILIILFIFYRMVFLKFSANDLAPTYWINMGAASISTLAGSLIATCSKNSASLHVLIPFINGFTLLFWSAATWWIPLLIILGWWRFVVHKVQFIYDASYWGMVFPLGMYSLCTLHIEKLFDFSFLLPVATLFFFLALVAWAITMLAFFYKTYNYFFRMSG